MYKFVSEKKNYEDYSSGRVLYGAPEATNFSVRLAIEIFLLCKDILAKKGKAKDFNLYDPFCGSGYSLTVLGLLHGEDIKNIFASDANEKILKFAEKNLSLLNVDGLSRRISELENFIIDYDKDSHRDALRSAKNIEQIVKGLKIETKIFELNVLENIQLNDFVKNIDIVITDIPYGNLVKWYGLNEGINPVQIMLDKIKKRLNPISIVAVVSDKKQEIKHEGFEQVKKFKVGKRKVFLLSPITT